MPTESARVPKENPPPVLGVGSGHKEGEWWGQRTETGEEQGRGDNGGERKNLLPQVAYKKP